MAAPPDFRFLFSLLTKTLEYPVPAIPSILSSFVPSPKSDLLVSKAHDLFYFSSRVEMGKVSNWLEQQEADLLSLIVRIQSIEEYIKPSALTASSFLLAVSSLYPDYKGASSSDKDPDAYRIFRDFVWVANQIDLKWKHLVQSFIGFRGIISVYESKTSRDGKQLLTDLHSEMFVACPVLTGLRNWAESVIEKIFPPSETPRCVLCNETLKASQKPVALPCAHSFCFRCIVAYYETKAQACPHCKRAESYNSIKDINFSIFEPWSILSRSFGIFKIRRLQIDAEPQAKGKVGSPPETAKPTQAIPMARGLLQSLQNFLQIHSQNPMPSVPTSESPFGGPSMQILAPSLSTSANSSAGVSSPVSPESARSGSPSPKLTAQRSPSSSPKPVTVLIDPEHEEVTTKVKKSPSESGENPKKTVIDGRRVLNTSCHQCKSSKDPTKLVFCTRPPSFDKKRRCRKKYCFVCLQRLYGWQKPTKAEQASWQCPSCLLLCKCAKCRREVEKSGLQPPTEFLKVPSPATRPPLSRIVSDPSQSKHHGLYIDTLVHEIEDSERSPDSASQLRPSKSPPLSRRGSQDTKVTRRQKSPTQRTSPYTRPSRSIEIPETVPLARSSSASPKGGRDGGLPDELGPRPRRGTWSFSDWNQYQVLDAIAALTGHLTASVPPGNPTPELPHPILHDEETLMPPPLGRPRSAPPGPAFFPFDLDRFGTPPQSPTIRPPGGSGIPGRISPLFQPPSVASKSLLSSGGTSLVTPSTSLISQPPPTSLVSPPSNSTFPSLQPHSPRIIRPAGFIPTSGVSEFPSTSISPKPLISPNPLASPPGSLISPPGSLISPPGSLISPPSLVSPPLSLTSPPVFGGFSPPLDSLVVPQFSPTGPGGFGGVFDLLSGQGPGIQSTQTVSIETTIQQRTRPAAPFPQLFDGLPDISPELTNPMSSIDLEDTY